MFSIQLTGRRILELPFGSPEPGAGLINLFVAVESPGQQQIGFANIRGQQTGAEQFIGICFAGLGHQAFKFTQVSRNEGTKFIILLEQLPHIGDGNGLFDA